MINKLNVDNWMIRSLFCMFFLALNGLASAAPNTPTKNFIDHGNGTVTHKTTGLVWKRCAEGMIWNDKHCKGRFARFTHEQALKIVSHFARRSDWRLPTLSELSSILVKENYDPAINTTVFPNTPATWFWSASVSEDDKYGAWNVSFFNADEHYDLKSETFAVRLVRGGK